MLSPTSAEDDFHILKPGSPGGAPNRFWFNGFCFNVRLGTYAHVICLGA
jgi:hypothetical protein